MATLARRCCLRSLRNPFIHHPGLLQRPERSRQILAPEPTHGYPFLLQDREATVKSSHIPRAVDVVIVKCDGIPRSDIHDVLGMHGEMMTTTIDG